MPLPAEHHESHNDTNVLLRRNRELATLRSIAETLNTSVSLQETFGKILPLLVELLGLDTGWIFMRNPDKDEFELVYAHSLPPALCYPSEAWEGGCTCQRTALAGRLRDTAQVVECSRLREATGDRHGLAYHASVPLLERGRMVGIMNVATSQWNSFTTQDLQILSAVGYQIASAIERIRLADQATQLALVEERNRLARDVHDTLAQELTGIALQLEAADALLESKPERARERIQQALARTRESLEEVRRSVLDLRAGPLERLSLPNALEQLIARFESEQNITIDCLIEQFEQRLPARIEETLYRIVQEGLANIRKHSQASLVGLRLWLEADEVHLQLSDNGRGFQPGRTQANHGFGLIGMQERAHLLRGSLQICSEAGKGVQITVRLPLEGQRLSN